MKTSDFDFALPDSAIAQMPAEPRDAARLLVHERATGSTAHAFVRDLPGLLRPGDLLVVNDTRVLAARLLGARSTGGRVEVLLHAPLPELAADARPGAVRWRAFVRPAKRLRPGATLDLESGAIAARAIERLTEADGSPGAEWVLELRGRDPRVPFDDVLASHGRMPLPPYIQRAVVGDSRADSDRERYQTVFAARPGAVAAPTAGLHFTSELLSALEARGIERTSVTLHVGAGTFRPVAVEDPRDHRMHAEDYELEVATVEAIARARRRGGRIVAIGTTSARVLETCADETGALTPGAGSTRLFLTPGRPFRVVDALLTNFHLPRSTLLMLVSAFAGRERVLGLYAEALARGYRFYSYGDAMLLV